MLQYYTLPTLFQVQYDSQFWTATTNRQTPQQLEMTHMYVLNLLSTWDLDLVQYHCDCTGQDPNFSMQMGTPLNYM